jgi:Acyl-CoA carboxylase epsilon subunit
VNAAAEFAEIRIVGGNPDDLEIAAVTAVLSAALEELAGEQRRRQSSGPSAWARSQRNVRAPMVRGAWRTGDR